MKTIILWLFSQIATFVETSMTWKIYGDFSLTHFILASLFLLALFNLFGFATHNFGSGVEGIALGFKNAENKRDKANYYNYTFSHKMIDSNRDTSVGHTSTVVYRVNRKTGDYKEIRRSRNRSSVERGSL